MIQVGPWLPDLPALNNPGSTDALNVIPGDGFYRPLPAFSSITTALTARAQGAVTFRDLSGNIHNFAGDATKLYKVSSGGLTWDDVSRTSGGAYATDASGRWVFAQFGNRCFATNGVDVLQVYTMGTSTNFAAASGSPPVCTFLAVFGQFLMLGRIATANNRVQWSAFNDPTDFVASQATQSDEQDFPDGGYVMGMVSGESGLIFQRNGIRRATYIGPPAIFQIDEISRNIGCMAEGSIAAYEQDVFFLSDNGFYHLAGQTQLRRIGAERVDRTFLADLDQSYLHRITACISPQDSLYVIGFPGAGNSSGTPDTLYFYHWPTDRWSRAEISHELVYAAASQSGYTLDGLDSVNSSIDALAYSLDSLIWAGAGRYILSGFDTSHKSGFFNGANMAATVDTLEAEIIPGGRASVQSLRPQVDGSSATITVTPIVRNLQHEATTTGSAVTANGRGRCPMRVNARYFRGRINIASGGTWTSVMGVDDVQAVKVGRR